ncbi:UNVERIFIED_CONTAM: hypothetical protein FKN15_047604 [Acipenser sinensis]
MRSMCCSLVFVTDCVAFTAGFVYSRSLTAFNSLSAISNRNLTLSNSWSLSSSLRLKTAHLLSTNFANADMTLSTAAFTAGSIAEASSSSRRDAEDAQISIFSFVSETRLINTLRSFILW